jgi:hypothetical protein
MPLCVFLCAQRRLVTLYAPGKKDAFVSNYHFNFLIGNSKHVKLIFAGKLRKFRLKKAHQIYQ